MDAEWKRPTFAIVGYAPKGNPDVSHLRGKPSVRQNVYGNWNAYIGSRKAFEIGASSFDADLWLDEQKKIRGIK